MDELFARRIRVGTLLLALAPAAWGTSACTDDSAASIAGDASAGMDSSAGQDATPDSHSNVDGATDAGVESGSDEAGPDGSVEGGPDGNAETGADGEIKYILGPGRADYVFELQDNGIGHHTGKALDEAIVVHGLGDVVARLPVLNHLTNVTGLHRVDSEGLPVPLMGEWGYSCIHLAGSDIDGAGMSRGGFPCFDALQGCDDPVHAGVAYDRAQAYYVAREDYERTAFPTMKRIIAHTGHYLFPHYGAAWGGELIVAEVGENINSVQGHIAFLRGASRQFGVPWGTDFSPWFANGVLDYWSGADRVWYRTDENGNIVEWYSGAEHGHSLSLNERTWYLSYMGGASYHLQEGAAINFFASKQSPTVVSPLGLLAQSFHEFVEANPDRGEPFVPMAIVLDFYHGLGLGTWNRPVGEETAWNHFPLAGAQRSTLSLLDAFWPSSFRVSPASEANYLVNGPVGDTVDVLADLSDPTTLSLLTDYSVVFLSGNVHWTPEWKSAVWNGLLANGGWLVLDTNSVHDAIYADLGAPALSAFVPGYSAAQLGVANVLAGRVVRVELPSHYPALIAELGRRALPFQVSGAGFALNRKASGSWLVTLVNNTGVDKQPRTPTVISGGPVTASLVPNSGQQLTQVTVRKSAHAPSWSANGLQVAIEPGGVVVLELDTSSGT